MKKILSTFAIAFIGVSSLFAASWKFPGWDKEASVYEAELARYDAAQEGSKPFSITEYNKVILAKAIAGRTGLTFADYLTAATNAATDTKFILSSLSSCIYDLFYKDKKNAANVALVGAFYRHCCIANGDKYTGYMATVKTMRNAIGISNDEAVERIFAGIPAWFESQSTATSIDRMLTAAYELLPACTMSDDKQLAELKKLNRLLSSKLVGPDKDQWEPVIAKLRTVIASY